MTRPKIPVDLILAKLAAEADKAQHRMEKAKDILLGPLNTEIAATPHDIVYQEDRVTLKYYRPAKASRLKTPLLLVYALLNRETVLDLYPEGSFVQHLLNEGAEVYLVDWGYPSRRDRYLTLDDHLNGYLDNIVEVIRRRHRIPQVNLMGFCLGGTFAVIYAALHPEKVKNLVTTVAPTNFDTDKGLFHIWMKGLEVERLVDTYGNMPGELLNICFLLLNPARLLFDKYVGFLENMDNKEFVENFIRMEKWIFDSPDVPGATFQELVRDFYQENLLIQGKMELEGNLIDLQKITMPVLNIYGKYDHLVPPGACELLTQKVGSRDTEDICLDTGHIGIYTSPSVQRELVPKIARWLTEREGKARDANSAPGKGKRRPRLGKGK
jgi:polyhydroxyalkanoate synthase